MTSFKMIKTLTVILAFVLSASYANAHVTWPSTKYEVGDCITPTDTTWSWYGKTASVEDVVFSKYLNGFAYQLYIRGINRKYFDKFSINSIDNFTAKVTPCPN